MRFIAELAMKSRIAAIAVASLSIFTGYFYFLGAAVVALVSMRKGSREGAFVLAWCLLPALVAWLWQSHMMPLISLLAVYAGAVILRNSQSWVAVLLIQLLTAVLFAVFLLVFQAESLQALQQVFDQFVASLNQQLAQSGQKATPQISSAHIDECFIAGIFAVMASFIGTISLVLARWWQAELFNPGGFGQEFRQLRFPPGIATALLVIIALCLSQGSGFQVWSALFALPLFFAGIALIHAWAKLRAWPSRWGSLFYLLLVLLDPLKLMLVILAVADSWLNFRGRLPPPPGAGSDDRDGDS